MCSIGEDDFGDEGGLHAMTRDTTRPHEEILSGICQKCNKSEVVVKLNFREPECKECFLAYVRHKFRATLGSSKILPKDAHVLLIFDGSSESTVLLDMMYFAQTQNSFKRLHCNVEILFIDESSCLADNPELSEHKLFEIQKFLLNYKFECFVISVCGKGEPVNFNNLNNYLHDTIRKDNEKKFYESVNKIKTLTSKQDYIEKIRKNIIGTVAKKLDKKFVFLSDISSNLASTLLTNISLGRGGSTASDVSLCDDRIPDLKMIRPLKDLNNNEIDNYLRVSEITSLNRIAYGCDLAANSSIQNLTTNFVLDLQKGFSSTISTVFRTGDKITTNSDVNSKLDNLTLTPKICSFCKSNLDYFDSKTLLAIEFSRLVSENTSKNYLEDESNLDTKSKDNLYSNNLKSLAELCHGCRNIYHDCLDPEMFS